MTISLSNNVARQSYAIAQGATQSSFTVSFAFFDDDDLNIFVDGTLKTLTTHYTVSGGSGSSGTVTMTSGNEVTGISGGSTVVITRDIDLDRTTDFPASGPFAVGTLNTELDKITAQFADRKDVIDRSVRLQDQDEAQSMELPLKAARLGKVLGFNATTGAVEAGPTIANVNSLADITTNINTVAGIQANVTTVAGIQANVTSVANISANVTSVANNETNINSAVSNASNINTVAGISSDVTAVAGKASLITADFVSDLNTLAVTDVINDINLLATSDIVSDLNTLATTDIVSDLNTLATTDIVSDINTLATSDIVTDLNLLATSDFVADLNTMATTTNVNNLSTVATNISNVNTAASSISEITSFNDLFAVSATAPTSPSNGDLWYDTTNSRLMVYVTNSFQQAGAYLQGLTSTHVFTCTANQTDFTTDDSNNTMSIHANGNTLVFMNGVRLTEGTSSTNDYYFNGNTIKLNSAADAGDLLLVEVFTKISTTQETSLNALVTTAQGHANTASGHATTATTKASEASTSASNASTSESNAAASASTASTKASEAATSASNASTSESNAASSASAAAASAATAQNAANFSVAGDTTPELGGNLDVLTHDIVSSSNRNIDLLPNGTGKVNLDGNGSTSGVAVSDGLVEMRTGSGSPAQIDMYCEVNNAHKVTIKAPAHSQYSGNVNFTLPAGNGSNGQFLQTDGSGNLSYATVDLTSINVVTDTSPQLGGDLDANSNDILMGNQSVKFGSSKWEIVLDTGDNDLLFKYNGTTVFKLASNGAVTSANDVTAFGSP